MQELQLRNKIPDYVFSISDRLYRAGFECFLVGGSVRDLLINKNPVDFDLATDAKPEQVLELFPKSISTNIRFGTVIILSSDSLGENHSVEVTTYRSEEDYIDGRWPSKVSFADHISRDLSRRDFTINALAINVQSLKDGLNNDVVDLFGGIDDLKNGIIRAVGDPVERFNEDGLRSFRACRLASQLGFTIEAETFTAIGKTLTISSNISIERIRDEFVKMLMKSPKPSVGINLLRDARLLDLFLPELLEGIGIKQPEEYHTDDVYDHILATVDAAEDSVKLAALFHDIGKPRCAEDGHFYKHDAVSADMAREIMKRLKFSNSEINRVTNLVRWHMFVFIDWRDGQDSSNWSDAAIRRLIKKVGGEEQIENLFKLRIADAISNPKSSFNPIELNLLEERISVVREQDMALEISDLNISGDDLIALGVKKGPEVGKILNELLEEVIENPSMNNKDQLIKLAKEYL